MTQKNEKNTKADSLAREVLTLSRNTLLVNLRFLDVALSRFTLETRQGSALSTDGGALFYDPFALLRSYQEEHTAPARGYLHLILHCVLLHVFHETDSPDVWDLACDIAVENAISELGLRAVAVERERKQRQLCDWLKGEIGVLTAEKIYRCLIEKPYVLSEAEELRQLFFADDHTPWRDAAALPAGAEDFWKDASRRLQVDMETFSRKQGDRAAAMMQNLREANRETHDYFGLLRKLATRQEPMKTDPEEFDYIFYTYGLRLYDNVPLIEPVEYRSSPRLREFVLAVDLCGLVSDEQARSFVRRTYETLKSTERVSSGVLLHILTCRGEREPVPVTITGPDELERYLSGLYTRDDKETDFRPAFLWVSDALRRRHIRHMKGLVYFTDALGPFPAKKPDFEQLFVFVNDNYATPDVPPWAVRMVLQRDELNERGQQ